MSISATSSTNPALNSLAGFGAILFSLMAVNFFFTDFHGFL